MDALETRVDQSLQVIASAATLEALDAERVAVVGKSGFVTEQLKQLGKLPGEERKAAGERINLAKDRVLEAIAARRAQDALVYRVDGRQADVVVILDACVEDILHARRVRRPNPGQQHGGDGDGDPVPGHECILAWVLQ